MYRIYYGDTLLYDVRSDEENLDDILVKKRTNEAHTLTFSKPHTNPVELQEIAEELVVFNREREVFRGQITELSEGMDFSQEVEARSDISYLNKSQIRAFDTLKDDELLGITPSGFVAWLVDKHNAQSDFRFVLGINEANLLWDGTVFVRSSESNMSTASVLREKLLDMIGGYVRTRFENGTRYIDYLADFPVIANQPIEFGENLLDYANGISTTDLYTAVIPYGSTGEGDEAAKIDITSIPDGKYDAGYTKRGDYIYSTDAVARYGFLITTQEFNDLTTPEGVMSAGIRYLGGACVPVRSLSLSAFDMSLLSPELDTIDTCEYVHCKAKPFGFNAYMACTEADISISTPENSTFTLGMPPDSLTGNTLKTIPAMIQAVDEIVVAVPAISEEAKAAAKDAQEASDEAKAAAEAAKNKTQTFRGDTYPNPPYNAGDRLKNSLGEEWVAKVSRVQGDPGGWDDWEPTIQNSAAIDAENAIGLADEAKTEAEAATEAANQAAIDAANAAAIAAGKSTTLIQSATPSAAYQLATTLWIDTTGGANTPKQWTGSAWVAITDKAAIDAANAAAAAQTTANAANAKATETGNWFFHDSAGAHVASVSGNANSGNNVLITSAMIALRNATSVLLAIKQSVIEFLGGQGYIGLSSTSPLGETIAGFDVYANSSRALNLYSAGTKGVRITSNSSDLKNATAIMMGTRSFQVGVGNGTSSEFGSGAYMTMASGSIGFSYGAVSGQLKDWAVAYGTVGGTSITWRYTKWASGRMEMYGTTSNQSVAATDNYGTCYYGSYTITNIFPAGYFVAKPQVFFGWGLNSNGLVTGVNMWNLNTTTRNLGYTIYCPTSSTGLLLTLDLYAIGRWK